ncbi:MAG TPA: cytochrome c-type biogenesis protein [Gemmatimonadaceae bacterium]|nr:cytochrome c-type biogenesis protein [Gemmatimonadaceae bacterium]
MKRVIVVIAALVALSAFTAFPANAQTRPITDSTLEARTTAVASTLRCPVCQGESIQDSPSELAQQMRSVVRDRLRSGESPDQVKAYFVSRYGEWILLEPKMTGLNVVLYVLPIVTVIGGLVLIVILVRRWTKPAEAGEG